MKYRLFVICFMLVLCMAGCDKQETVKKTEITTTEEKKIPVTEKKTEKKKVYSINKLKKKKAGTTVSKEMLTQIGDRKLFYKEKISDSLHDRMKGNSYKKNCVTKREELRYVRVLHKTRKKGQVKIGEIVCNKAIADDLLDIFWKLYKKDYPIEKMLLIDDYKGDDEASMADNNTSCFNFRVVPGSSHLSQHAYGRAIDINPRYNPYVTSKGYSPVNAGAYVDRSKAIPYKIDHKDLCYRLFIQHGFVWGGNWNSSKDYQHFQKK